MSRKKFPEGLAAGICSCCDNVDITIGGQYKGGIRWCRDCIKLSFGWFQLGEEKRESLMAKMDAAAVAQSDAIHALMGIPEEMRHNIGIGESMRRLMDQDFKEAGMEGVLP